MKNQVFNPSIQQQLKLMYEPKLNQYNESYFFSRRSKSLLLLLIKFSK